MDAEWWIDILKNDSVLVERSTFRETWKNFSFLLGFPSPRFVVIKSIKFVFNKVYISLIKF
jgi:hypothetical protein